MSWSARVLLGLGLLSLGCAEKKGGPGVDLGAKILRLGALNDESGPAAGIGRPFAEGKRLLARMVNEGQSDLLPQGWTLELIERDVAYDPQRATASYAELEDQTLFITTSFGTPVTLALVPQLVEDGMVAFPASLSSLMAQQALTPPLGPSYESESQRGVDWAVSQAGAQSVMAAIVYQPDDYGEDALAGVRSAAEHHGIAVTELAADPAQDAAVLVEQLRAQGATHVLLATLPPTTDALLRSAEDVGFSPIWIASTPAWDERFFDVLPAPTRLYRIAGYPFWGEQVPGMERFLQTWAVHGRGRSRDPYILASYISGLVQLEAFARALEDGDTTRAGYQRALSSLQQWDAGGLIQPIDLSAVPYQTSDRTRVLQPIAETRSWRQIADYQAPRSKGEVQ